MLRMLERLSREQFPFPPGMRLPYESGALRVAERAIPQKWRAWVASVVSPRRLSKRPCCRALTERHLPVTKVATVRLVM